MHWHYYDDAEIKAMIARHIAEPQRAEAYEIPCGMKLAIDDLLRMDDDAGRLGWLFTRTLLPALLAFAAAVIAIAFDGFYLAYIGPRIG